MINSDDLTRMKATNATVIDDQETSIAILRGASTTLAAQNVRLVGLGNRPLERTTIGGDVVQIALLVVGETTLNILRGDRFFVGTYFYEVIELRPGEDIKVVAECKLIT